MIHPNVLSLIGQTPLVALQRLNPFAHVRIAVKLEENNPGGSVKDRVALAMIEQAESTGRLTPDKTVLEATSGNTGIGLAMVCAVKGYSLLLLMPESASEERKQVLLAYGAKIRLTPGHLGTDGAIEEAYRLAREEPERYVLVDQFNNPASVTAHYRTTAQEIWDQTEGQVTHAVACLGTSGTIMGLSKRLKELNPAIRIVAVEPYAGHKIQGLKNMQESYPPGIYDKRTPDMILNVEDEAAFELCRKLAVQEGIFAGMSSGAALAGALQLASNLESGLVVVIFPDGGTRYLSTPLFAQPQKQGLRVHDLKKRLDVTLQPEKDRLRMFTPGPGLDQWADAAAWRRIVLLDVAARFQGQKGVRTEVTVGVADLDDRAVSTARTAGKSLQETGRDSLARMGELAALLGIGDHVRFVAAGQCVPTLLQICRKLLSKGLGYEKLRSVYFDILRDKDYGSLLRIDLEKIRPGLTVDLDEYVKDNPRDFTLLKRTSLADLKDGYFVQTEWGSVRPSWYLQMAGTALEPPAAGPALVLADETHRFPHLDNLSAIWRLGAGFQPQAWITAQISCLQPSQSCAVTSLFNGNAHPKALRFWLLSGSYHKPLQCSLENFSMWSKNWQRLQQTLTSLLPLARSESRDQVGAEIGQTLFSVKKAFAECMEKDLNLPKFWPDLFKFCKGINTAISQNRLNPAESLACVELLRGLDEVLGLLDWSTLPCKAEDLPKDVRELLTLRETARREKNFVEADRLRERIKACGYRLQDAPEKTILFIA
jgi:cysteinyl-tRNA synthetase